MKEYQAFVDDINAVAEGKELVLNIKDLTPGKRKYESRLVKAILTSSAGRPAGGDRLWLRGANGERHPTPWTMKITEELGDSLPVPPYSDVSDRAGM